MEEYNLQINSYKHSGWINKIVSTLIFTTWSYVIITMIISIFYSDTHWVMNLILFILILGFMSFYMSILDYWLWVTSGRELITVSNKKLIVEKRTFIMSRKKVFDLAYVNNMNYSNVRGLTAVINGFCFLSYSNGGIRFDYGMNTYRFANGFSRDGFSEILSNFKENENFCVENFER